MSEQNLQSSKGSKFYLELHTHSVGKYFGYNSELKKILPSGALDQDEVPCIEDKKIKHDELGRKKQSSIGSI
jgi:hypothetical protein